MSFGNVVGGLAKGIFGFGGALHDVRKGALDVEPDPQLKALSDSTHNIYNEMQRESDTYKAQAPELGQKQTNIATDQLKTNLAKNMLKNTEGANKQGMLYSGTKQKNEQGLQGKYGTDVVQAKNEISQSIDEQSKKMQQQALQAQIQAAQVDQMMKEDMWRQALSQRSGVLGQMDPIASSFSQSVWS